MTELQEVCLETVKFMRGKYRLNEVAMAVTNLNLNKAIKRY